MKNKDSVRLEMPALSVNEGFARVFASAFAARLDPTLEELADIRTAVSEAVTNAIVHAYPDGVGTVVLTARVKGERLLEYTVKDRGRGIEDIPQAMTPMFTTGGEERSGLGFTIMESFTDSLKVTSSPGKGTTVRFCKKIAPRL
ncbi:MAG: anti-sigma F factor [Clostridia bacterium]|nr:anti-sigma F factor [Clostridia bacterium]